MALKFFWTCESAAIGASDYTAGADTSATAAGGATIGGAAGMVGTNGIIIASSADHYALDAEDEIFSSTEGALGFLFRWSSHGGYCTLLMANGGDANIELTVYFDASSNTGILGFSVRDYDTTTDAVVANAGTSPNTIYGAVCRWNQTTGYLRVEVYGDPLGTPTEIASGEDPSGFTMSAWADNTGGFQIGEVGAAALAAHIDNVFIGDTYNEPIQDNFGITEAIQYGAASGVTVTDAGDEQFYNGETGLTVTGTGFSASGNTLKICPTDDVDDASAVTQTITTEGPTDTIVFTAVRGALSLNTNLYLFVVNGSAESNAAGHVVQFYTPVVNPDVKHYGPRGSIRTLLTM